MTTAVHQRTAATRILHSSIWVPRPPAAIWPFFSNAANLAVLTPPWLDFEIKTPSPITMAEDTRIDYRLRVRGIPLRWRTRIARWEPPVCFVDEQELGPYRRWVHTHTFTAMGGGTRIGDHVEFAVRGGPLAPLISRWFVDGDVTRVFQHRLLQIGARFGADPATGIVRLDRRAPPMTLDDASQP